MQSTYTVKRFNNKCHSPLIELFSLNNKRRVAIGSRKNDENVPSNDINYLSRGSLNYSYT